MDIVQALTLHGNGVLWNWGKKTEEFEDGGLALKSVSSKPKARDELQIHPHRMQKMIWVCFNIVCFFILKL